MRKITMLLAAAASMVAMSGSAQAVTLIGAAVTGPSGTIWTTLHTGNYVLFLQTPGGQQYLNPNDETLNLAINTSGNTGTLLNGDGYRVGETSDSDPFYTLTLNFDNGKTLVGNYTGLGNVFTGGTSFMDGGVSYSLAEFSYRRDLGNPVSEYTATPGGDGNDYNGNFRITAASVGAVPEPATWAMMLAGFGMIGFAARRRSSVKTTVRYA